MSLVDSNWQAFMTGDGPDQEQRLPAALMEGYFKVDELGFEKLLALSAELASALRFYDLENRGSGNWAELFMGDEAVIMALILSKDIERIEADYLRYSGPDYVERVVMLSELAVEIDRWQKRLMLAEHQSGLMLGKKLSAMISVRLADNLHDLGAIAGHLSSHDVDRIAINYDQFSPEWGIVKIDYGHTFGRARQCSMQDDAKLEMVLRTAFYSFLNGLSELKEMAAVALIDSLKNQRHDPAMGLFISFLQLFQRLQKRINGFTQRHLDFYYERVLRAVAREQAPESAHLLFTAEGSSAVVIPKGAEFSAGKDQTLKEIIYLADNDITVTDVRVSMINTLYLERDRLISPEHELNYVTRIKAHRLPSQSMGTVADAVAWPIFGASPRGIAAVESENATLGFAVASAMLLLKEGRRKIALTVVLDDPVDLGISLATFRDYLGDNVTATEPQQQSEKLFTHIFHHFLALEEPPADRTERIRLADRAKKLVAAVPVRERENIAAGDLDLACGMIHKLYLLACLQTSESEPQFLHSLGRVFSHYLLSRQAWLEEGHKQMILTSARAVLSQGSYGLVSDLLQQERGSLFYKLVKQLFSISLTSSSGWYLLKNYAVLPASSLEDEISNGFQIVMVLDPDVDAIVACDEVLHGDKWKTLEPVVQLLVNPQANFYPYSLFDEFLMKEIRIAVEVEGVRDIVAYNNHGQIDTSKPFNPFGPIPNASAYFAFGSYEIARKKIQHLDVDIEWGGLPNGKGGFSAHYQGYDTPYSNSSFVADVNVLQSGKWWPAQGEARHRLALFDSAPMSEQLHETRCLNISVLNYAKPITATISEEEFSQYDKSRHGLYRLMLSGMEDPFGYGSYSALLTRVLSQNVRLRKPRPIPNPPYIPLIHQITLNYRARTTVDVGVASSSATKEKIFHIHPFGLEAVDAMMIEAGHPLLPAYHHDGNLHIGLSATKLKGVVTLFFDVAEDSAHTIASQRPTLHWFYLASNCWHPLTQAQLISDTTNGFLSSGIVTLDIPAGINKNSTIMPAGLYWLRVSGSGDLTTFCSLRSIHTHGLKVQRRDNGDSRSSVAKGWQPMASISGLGKTIQIGAVLAGRKHEDKTHLKIRTSERLRHKQRATTAWDYEHLVMEKFPEVFKVKCFNHMRSIDTKPHPGSVLIVVVPYLNRSGENGCSPPMISAIELEEIARYLRQLTSSFTTIEVRNPVYERIQVRCTVKFHNPQLNGLYTTQLDNDITRYICPWKKIGYQAKFGWAIRSEDVESYIRTLDYVDFVTNFSMLHITEEQSDSFVLADTARSAMEYQPGDDVAWSPLLGVDNDDRITPRHPWSLAVPSRHHYIDTVNKIRHIDAEPTGIGEIEIGTTFIINGTQSRG